MSLACSYFELAPSIVKSETRQGKFQSGLPVGQVTAGLSDTTLWRYLRKCLPSPASPRVTVREKECRYTTSTRLKVHKIRTFPLPWSSPTSDVVWPFSLRLGLLSDEPVIPRKTALDTLVDFMKQKLSYGAYLSLPHFALDVQPNIREVKNTTFLIYGRQPEVTISASQSKRMC